MRQRAEGGGDRGGTLAPTIVHTVYFPPQAHSCVVRSLPKIHSAYPCELCCRIKCHLCFAYYERLPTSRITYIRSMTPINPAFLVGERDNKL